MLVVMRGKKLMRETLPVFVDTFSKIAFEMEPTPSISLHFFPQSMLRHCFKRVIKWLKDAISGSLSTEL